MSLEVEMETYTRVLPELLRGGDEGKYVVIKGAEVVGVYPDLDSAFRAGYARFNLEEFLCRPIERHEPVLRASWRVR